MPECGLYVTHCDLPVWIDSYSGCVYDCGYCLERINGRKAGEPVVRHSVRCVRDFIEGKRTYRTNWCDWDIPIHWGVTSEPFQPCEMKYRVSYWLLRLFAETGYPVVISTKSVLLSRGQYFELLGECNAVVQVSMVSRRYDSVEGGPDYRTRFCMLHKLSSVVKRLVVRVQPFMVEDLNFVIGMLPAYAASGVHGIVVEGLKRRRKTASHSERVGNAAVYPLGVLKPAFYELRDACHEQGLRFYSGENRLRYLGDSENCCGTDGVAGFVPCRANLNYDLREYSAKMREPGTAGVFNKSRMSPADRERLSGTSFMEAMEDYYGNTLGVV